MTLYIAKAFGWQGIVEAPTAREALPVLKQLSRAASLLPSDITSCRPATQEEIDWHRSMGGRA